tara:strand:- start:658 stop:816 length:159 start_codon:yes stop_codon:yes gene_type:complete
MLRLLFIALLALTIWVEPNARNASIGMIQTLASSMEGAAEVLYKTANKMKIK